MNAVSLKHTGGFSVVPLSILSISANWNFRESDKGEMPSAAPGKNNSLYQDRLGTTTWEVTLQKTPEDPGEQQGACEPAVGPGDQGKLTA